MDKEISSADVNQLQPKIFRLKMDHFEEIFDFLSLKDLTLLSETCKKMQSYVGYYIKTNYAAIKPYVEVQSNGINMWKIQQGSVIKLNALSSFVKKLEFVKIDSGMFQSHANELSMSSVKSHLEVDQFKSLMEIQLIEFKFTDQEVSYLKPVLGQLETVKLKVSQSQEKNKEFYVNFLQFCPNVKKLCIHGDGRSFFVGADNSWLRRAYPTLEHLELTVRHFSDEKIPELQTFFDQNSHIKSFATNAETILVNRNAFVNTKLKLDVLSIQFSEVRSRSFDNNTFISIRNLLNELHEHGAFKQLHVYFTFCKLFHHQQDINHMTAFNGLTKLSINAKESIALPSLMHLKQLCINQGFWFENLSTAAVELANLEFIKCARVNDIMPFIRNSPKLKAIVVTLLDENDAKTLNIEELNKERSKLSNARKVTIYVEDEVYLKAKWSKNGTDRKFIEIKRIVSHVTQYNNFDYIYSGATDFFFGKRVKLNIRNCKPNVTGNNYIKALSIIGNQYKYC